MSTNAEQYYETNAAAMRPVRSEAADLVKGFAALHHAAMRAGALSVLEKELIALGIGLAARCENCVYAHVDAALRAGATRQQVIEAAGVAVMMQGGPAYTYLPRVTEALEALAPKAETMEAK